MAERKRIARVTRIVRGSVHGLLDQSQPFGRLALVHTLQAAGTACVTVSLAGSLFFSISPHAAEGKVLLYLLLTIAPFALVGPALSPLLDRGRDARRSSVGIANFGSAILCLFMARDIHGLLLFPEAFGLLVLGKLYLVARALRWFPRSQNEATTWRVPMPSSPFLHRLADSLPHPLQLGSCR